MKWLRHPLAIPLLALLCGVLVAGLLAWFGPRPGPIGIALPTEFADFLGSTSAQPRLILHRPATLWLLPLALLPYLVVVAARSLVDLPAWQIAAQMIARVLVLLALALALAAPSLQTPQLGKTVVFVLDVSDSIDDDQLAASRTSLVDAWPAVASPDEDDDPIRLRVITYAEDSEVLALDEASPGSAIPPIEQLRHSAGLASDHAGALRLAAALVDPDTEGRVVLFTDGKGNPSEREALVGAVDALERRGVTVHVRSFPAQARGDILVEAVSLPDELRIGQTFDVVVDLVSTSAVPAVVGLQENGVPNPLAPVTAVELRGGRQQVRIPARVSEPGPVVFTATVRPAGEDSGFTRGQNRTTRNDAAAVVGDVQGRPRVLHVGSDPSAALPRALRADHLHVDDLAPGAVPDTPEGLAAWDLVIFSDIPARAISGAKQAALTRYVEEGGGGFLMIGGENAFGVGGWGKTPVERLLPVRFEGERQREQPKLALVLVIDKSGSMSSEDKLDLVKEASRATARTLDPTDELGVIAFDSRPRVLVRLQPAANRIRISADIRRLTAGGGTNALPALREAYLQLAGSNAVIKHVILLSDGQSPESGISALLGDMRDANLTVSTVGVGPGAGKDLLSRMAEQGRGRFYFSQDGTDVPRIFSRETLEVTRNAVVEQKLYPRITKNAQALRGIDFASAPPLRGIVPVLAKPLAEVLLRTHAGDPLLVRGRRGLGRTAAFASDAKPRWAAHWINWGGFAKFWSQVARDTMRQGVAALGGASLSVRPGSGGTYRAIVDVDSAQGFANELRGTLTAVDPSTPPDDPQRSMVLDLELTAPGRYEAKIPDIRAGQRLLKARLFEPDGADGRLVAEAVNQVSIPYPSELAPEQLASRADWLRGLITAGTADGALEPVLRAPGRPDGRTRDEPLWPTVVWMLVVPLVLVDLLLRRLALGRRRVPV